MPTTRYNDDNVLKDIDRFNKLVLPNASQLKHATDKELGVKFTNDVRITELLSESDGIFRGTNEKEATDKSVDLNTFDGETMTEKYNMLVKSIDINAFETEFNKNHIHISENDSPAKRNEFILCNMTQNTYAENHINYDSFGVNSRHSSQEFSMTENEVEGNRSGLNTFGMKSKNDSDTFSTPIKSIDRNMSSFTITETDLAIQSIEVDTSITNKNRKKLPLSETELAVKSISLNNFQCKSEDNRSKSPLPEICESGKDINITNAFETDNHKFYNLIENDRAVKSITLEEMGTENDRIDISKTDTVAAVKIIKTNAMDVESPNTVSQIPDVEDTLAVKSVHSTFSETESQAINNQLIENEHNLAAKSILLNTFESESQDLSQNKENYVPIKHIKLNNVETKVCANKSKINIISDVAVKKFDPSAYGAESRASKDLMTNKIVDVYQNHEQDNLYNDSKYERLNEDKQCTVDTIDRNLEKALKTENNQELFSLEDLLVSPTGGTFLNVSY